MDPTKLRMEYLLGIFRAAVVTAVGSRSAAAELAKKGASLLTKGEIFPQFECAQTIFLDFGRRPDQRKRRVRKLLPDSKIFRSNREPPESEHVSARFGHSPDLSPCDLLDGPRAWSVRYSARAHFEGVELQRERRQRQPQISQFFGARVVPVVPGGCRLRFAAGNIHRWYSAHPRRPQPPGDIQTTILISFNQLQSTETGVAAFVLATDGACPATRSVTGNCNTVARCPSQSCVTSTWLPSGNSIASW